MSPLVTGISSTFTTPGLSAAIHPPPQPPSERTMLDIQPIVNVFLTSQIVGTSLGESFVFSERLDLKRICCALIKSKQLCTSVLVTKMQ